MTASTNTSRSPRGQPSGSLVKSYPMKVRLVSSSDSSAVRSSWLNSTGPRMITANPSLVLSSSRTYPLVVSVIMQPWMGKYTSPVQLPFLSRSIRSRPLSQLYPLLITSASAASFTSYCPNPRGDRPSLPMSTISTASDASSLAAASSDVVASFSASSCNSWRRCRCFRPAVAPWYTAAPGLSSFMPALCSAPPSSTGLDPSSSRAVSVMTPASCMLAPPPPACAPMRSTSASASSSVMVSGTAALGPALSGSSLVQVEWDATARLRMAPGTCLKACATNVTGSNGTSVPSRRLATCAALMERGGYPPGYAAGLVMTQASSGR
mmetsp:Transcript_4338/g.10536  ORF Transcript_4338/g.10536 Transcript_4338/m.10536 type:complete len:323 (+) Transcript_4338:413-1381(+)